MARKEPEPKQEATLPLHLKYRPKTWDEVIGQDLAVDTMADSIASRASKAYLLVGPSGCGKTTLARIAAHQLGAAPQDTLDFDAASNSGVDRMREIMGAANYVPFGDSKARCFVIDECHGLSRQAWDAMLKTVEEGAADTYWFFCTTNVSKVPTTIKTRCTTIQLKELKEKDLGRIYDDVCDAERIDIPGDAGDLIIRESGGSPRQLLVNLDMCRGVRNKKEAAELLKTALDTDTIRELCQFLVKRSGSWTAIMALYDKLADENPEGVRIQVVRYMEKVLAGAKTDKAAVAILPVFDAFADSYNAAEGRAPLLRSIARAMF